MATGLHQSGIKGFASRTLILVGALWGMATLALGCVFFKSEGVPGNSGVAKADWPVGTQLSLRTDQHTLVMFVHPHCPCSNASVYELTEILTHCQGLVGAKVLFIKPAGFTDTWARTGLWEDVLRIPGVTASIDSNGAEAARFGAETSGDVRLYDCGGRLMFSGGITQMRGHIGDNPGATSVTQALQKQGAVAVKTPVYGCPLTARN